MSARRCTNCAAYRHCLKAAIRGKDAIRQHCHEWKPLPGLDTKEKKPVAGCEYCRLPVAVYREDTITGASVVMFTASRTMRVMDRDRIQIAEFPINCCPHCGRDLRGD